MNKWLNFGGDPDNRLDTGIVFRIRDYWEIRKVVLTDCAALAGIAIATMTSCIYILGPYRASHKKEPTYVCL